MTDQSKQSFWQKIQIIFEPITKPFGKFWDLLTKPHSSIQDIGKQRQARLLSGLLVAVILLLGVGLASAIALQEGGIASQLDQVFLIVLLLIAYGISRTSRFNLGSILLVASITLSPTFGTLQQDPEAIIVSIYSFMPLGFVLGSALLSAGVMAGFTVIIFIGLSFLPMLAPNITPIEAGTVSGNILSLGIVLSVLTAYRNATERLRLKEIETANRELEMLTVGLEQRVTERTRALETSAEVSRRLASILDPSQLATAVVNEIRNAYDYYYAQIYLFDDAGENLVLTAGTGEAGAAMLKRGHSLSKGRGLVGRAAETRESILVSDTSQDPNWLPNDLLPDTKTEAAIPITIGDQVLGVLDVQDDLTNDINPADITLLESLANQVAISLQNANSYTRAEAALQEARSLVENAPEAVVIIDLTTGLFADPNENAVKLYGLQRDELVKAGPAQMSPPRQPDGRDSTEAAMEKIGEAMQGKTPVFDWIHRNGQGQDIPCEIHLVRMPGDKPRVRATVIDITERKHLQELTALRARQQEAINTITQRIQSATTIEEAMQVAARELGHAVGNRQTLVALEQSALGGNGKTTVNE